MNWGDNNSDLLNETKNNKNDNKKLTKGNVVTFKNGTVFTISSIKDKPSVKVDQNHLSQEK